MSARIRWYNRLAAWLYGVIAEPLLDLAVPVWVAEAEADIEEQWEAEAEHEPPWLDDALAEAEERGYRQGLAEGGDDAPF